MPSTLKHDLTLLQSPNRFSMPFIVNDHCFSNSQSIIKHRWYRGTATADTISPSQPLQPTTRNGYRDVISLKVFPRRWIPFSPTISPAQILHSLSSRSIATENGYPAQTGCGNGNQKPWEIGATPPSKSSAPFMATPSISIHPKRSLASRHPGLAMI